MGSKSNRKGKVGEREFAAVLQSLGFVARRGIQFAGGADSPDIVSNIPGVHFEVKRVEAFKLYKALDQAREDAGPEKIPVVAHRKSRQPWILIVPLEDVVKFAESIVWSNENGA